MFVLFRRMGTPCGTRGARDRIHFGKRLNADPFEARRAPRRISPGKFSEPGENLGHRKGDHRSPEKAKRQTSSLPRHTASADCKRLFAW